MNRQRFFQFLGPALAALLWCFTDLSPGHPQVTQMAGITVWMCTWWFSEAVGFGVTAMVPVLVMPLFGLANVTDVAHQYTDSIIFLFIGGFMLAFAIEKWNFHKRIALKILSLVGQSPNTILMGVMLSAWLISNWISNTATTMMLFSAVVALVQETSKHMRQNQHKFAAALLLGLAFSATIGGMATPVGTPPNMYFFRSYLEHYPDNNDLTFLSWSSIGFPISFLLLVVTYVTLQRYYLHRHVQLDMGRDYFKQQYKQLGRFSQEEKWVAVLFGFCVLLWFTRADIITESFHFYGWKNVLPNPKYADDSMVAVCAALLLFLIPSKKNKGEALLVWEDATKLRYDIILMFGSGFALAYGFEISGLSGWLAATLAVMKGIPVLAIIIGICVIVTIISEFASNIASIQLAIPVMIALQQELDLPPLLLMMPATFAASLGFMLPVATAANTIVFGTRQIQVKDMLKVGLILDLAGIAIIAVFCYLYLS